MNNRPRVAFVIHRYHAEIAGGAERHCRDVALHMACHWEVTVLTTCARDDRTWANAYAPGPSHDGPVRVLRFPVTRQRDYPRFDAISPRVLDGPHTRAEEERWIEEQGPLTPGLTDHLGACESEYDAIIFFTYLYWTTVRGIAAAPERAWLVPTAHDEKPIRLEVYNDVFRSARAILYNTEAERAFCAHRFAHRAPLETVVGCGIDLPPPATENGAALPDGTAAPALPDGLAPGYLLYLGRVDRAKNVDALLADYLTLVRDDPSWPDLVLLGPVTMDLPRHPKVRPLGRVDEPTKLALLRRAAVLLQPSLFESLSLVLLEGWLAGIPALVNGRCAVLREQVIAARGGLYYDNSAEFREALAWLLSRPRAAAAMARSAREFTLANYSWSVIERKYLDVFARLCRAR